MPVRAGLAGTHCQTHCDPWRQAGKLFFFPLCHTITGYLNKIKKKHKIIHTSQGYIQYVQLGKSAQIFVWQG